MNHPIVDRVAIPNIKNKTEFSAVKAKIIAITPKIPIIVNMKLTNKSRIFPMCYARVFEHRFNLIRNILVARNICSNRCLVVVS